MGQDTRAVGQNLAVEGRAGPCAPRGWEGGSPPTLSVCRETEPVFKQQTCPNSAGMLMETSVLHTQPLSPYTVQIPLPTGCWRGGTDRCPERTHFLDSWLGVSRRVQEPWLTHPPPLQLWPAAPGEPCLPDRPAPRGAQQSTGRLSTPGKGLSRGHWGMDATRNHSPWGCLGLPNSGQGRKPDFPASPDGPGPRPGLGGCSRPPRGATAKALLTHACHRCLLRAEWGPGAAGGAGVSQHNDRDPKMSVSWGARGAQSVEDPS